MPNLKDLSVVQLQRAIEIKQRIETLEAQLDSIEGGGEVAATPAVEAPAPAKRKYQMTAAHRRKLIKTLAKARAIRWANAKSNPAKKGKRRLSAAGRAAIIAATKARWARIKRTGAEVPMKLAAGKKRRKMSSAWRAKIAASARARWAKAKADGKSSL